MVEEAAMSAVVMTRVEKCIFNVEMVVVGFGF